jgi:pSer/pThr/pTyr-binding forkhead associated (FHA) protein
VSARFFFRVRAGSFRSLALGEGENVIGRDPGLWLTLRLEGISRRHARVVARAGAWWIEDLASTNGTFVNGESVDSEPLRHLDVISLGRRTELVFVVPGDARPAAAARIVRATLTRVRDGAVVEILPGEAMLGRAPECAVPALDPGVSDFHARLERSGRAIIVEDLGPGTLVNGRPVSTVALADGDEVSLAGLEAYRVVIEAAPVGPAPRDSQRRTPDHTDPNATRYEWGPEERQALAELRRTLGRLAGGD